MGVSISIRISTQTIEALINASPVPSLIIKTGGAVVCCNQAARELLQLQNVPETLEELFGTSRKLGEAVRQARRIRGPVPAKAHAKQADREMRLNFEALPGESGRPTQLLLVTAMTRERGNRNMLLIKQQLDEATEEQRRLQEANERLRRTVEQTLPRLKALSHTDPLTGLFNRRFYDMQVSREWNRARRQGSMLALLYVDIDYFKKFNDALGHPAGDACLKQVAEALQSAVTREFDRVCRIGGEEFALLLPMTSERGAAEVGRRVLAAVRALALPHPEAPGEIVTVSVGVGTCVPDLNCDLATFIKKVDDALYRAKKAGRDQMMGLREQRPTLSESSEASRPPSQL